MINPIVEPRNKHYCDIIKNSFNEMSYCSHNHYVLLYKYIKNVPEQYFSFESFRLLFNWLNTTRHQQKDQLLEFVNLNHPQLSKAFLFLRQINSMTLHDSVIDSVDDYDLMKKIDEEIHPLYLRLVEAVLAQFIKPIAFFSRLQRDKPVDGLDIYNLVQEVELTPLKEITIAYNHIIRNGIAHGGIRYLEKQIEYSDKKGRTVIVDYRQIIELFDNLVDICNGLAKAYKEFFLIFIDDGYVIPQDIYVEELIEETKSPWWRIEGCIDSVNLFGTQLIIYSRPNTTDYSKVLFFSVQTAILSEYLHQGYDRYFISLKSHKCYSGFAKFSGKEMKRLREENIDDITAFKNILEEPGLFYIPKRKYFKFFYKLDSFYRSFQIQSEMFIDYWYRNIAKTKYHVKNARMHINGYRMVLSGEIVLTCFNCDDIQTYIKKHCRTLTMNVFRTAKKDTTLPFIQKLLPLGYSRISIFTKEMRKRRLNGFGLGKELICTIQVSKIKRIRSPDIYESTIEQIGKYRIGWNKNWLTTASS